MRASCVVPDRLGIGQCPEKCGAAADACRQCSAFLAFASRVAPGRGPVHAAGRLLDLTKQASVHLECGQAAQAAALLRLVLLHSGLRDEQGQRMPVRRPATLPVAKA